MGNTQPNCSVFALYQQINNCSMLGGLFITTPNAIDITVSNNIYTITSPI